MAISAVQDALGLGVAKVDTAYAGTEAVVDVLEEFKARLIAATEEGVDKAKIHAEAVERACPHVFGTIRYLCLRVGQHEDGGEDGIRTHDTLLTYTPLAGERLRPLGHLSGAA